MDKLQIHASGEDYLEAVLMLPRRFSPSDRRRPGNREKIYGRHCVFTKGLIKLGVDPERAEQDACRIEHAISDESFQKLKEMLQNIQANK